MKYNYKLTSTFISPKVSVTSKDASAFSKALASMRLSPGYKSKVRSLASKLTYKVDKAIVTGLGFGTIKTGTPTINPTFTTTLDVVRSKKDNRITSINRAVVSAISIKNPLRQPNINVEIDSTTQYYDKLSAFIKNNQNNSKKLFDYLVTERLTTRLVTNFNDISLFYKQGNRTVAKKISFSIRDIKKAISSGKASVNIAEYEDRIDITISINPSAINSASTYVSSIITKELSGGVGAEIVRLTTAEAPVTNLTVMREISAFLTSLGLEYVIRYLPNGVLNNTTVLLRTISDKKVNYQAFISSIQWTALVQAKLGDTMARSGAPEPPDLKERTGRFRSSVNVVANYRTNTIYYTYMPLYSSLEKYGYNPDLQVETAIREVAQQQFARNFTNILKG